MHPHVPSMTDAVGAMNQRDPPPLSPRDETPDGAADVPLLANVSLHRCACRGGEVARPLGTALPPWLRMRGGGSAQSRDSNNGAAGGASGGKQRVKATASSLSTRSGDYTGWGPSSAAPMRAVEATGLNGLSRPAEAGSVMGLHAAAKTSPDTPRLHRPVLTIFTTVDDDEDDGDDDEDDEERRDGGTAGDDRRGSGCPRQQPTKQNSPGVPPTDSSRRPLERGAADGDSDDEGDEGSVLRATATSLLPVDYFSLFGNGMDPSPVPGTAANAVSPSSFAPPFLGLQPAPHDLPCHEGRSRRTPTPPQSPGVTDFATPDLACLTDTATLADHDAASAHMLTPLPRVSATPVVPIMPFNETATRRKVVHDILSHYGPDAPRQAEEPIPAPPLAGSTTAVHRGKAARKEADKQRKQREKAEAKGKAKPVPAVKTPPMTREQIIRVGAMRLHQRLLNLQVTMYRVKNDGNCQFRAIAFQLLGSEDYHDLIRAHVVSYMKKVRKEKFDFYFDSAAAADAYFDKLAKVGSWGDELSLRGASDALFINVHILSSSERNCYSCYQPSQDAPPAPTFLVDVEKIKERRRRERQYRRRQKKSFSLLHGSMMSAASVPSVATSHGPSAGDYWDSQAVKSRSRAGSSPHRGPRRSAASDTPTTSLLQPGEGVLLSAAGAGVPGDSDDSEDDAAASRRDEEPVDAIALQQALQKKLEKTRIKASVPFFTPDGQLRLPKRSAPNAGSYSVTASSSVCGFGSNANSFRAGSVGPAPPAGGGSLASGHSFQVTSTLRNKTTPYVAEAPLLVAQARGRTPGQQSGAGPASASPPPSLLSQAPGSVERTVGRALALEPDVTANCSEPDGCVVAPKKVMDLANFGVTGDDAVNITRYQTLCRPPTRLLRPAVDNTAGAGGCHHQDPGTVSPPLPPKLTAARSFPIFPTVDGGNVMLLAARTQTRSGKARASASAESTRAQRRALDESFAALRHGATASFCGHGGGTSSYAGSLDASFTWMPGSAATSMRADGAGARHEDSDHTDCSSDGDEAVFVFEPRREPIDVFLSYLYPVHYNALCVIEPDSDGEDGPRAAGTLLQPQGEAPTSSFAEERPQFLNASFLRAPCEDAR